MVQTGAVKAQVLRTMVWAEMPTHERAALMHRGLDDIFDPALRSSIVRILDDVREHGDEAVCRALRDFDGISLQPYWSYRQALLDGLADPIESEGEALEALEAAMMSSIAGQAVADVPVGAFLSGGIDSSTVVPGGKTPSTRRKRRMSPCPK